MIIPVRTRGAGLCGAAMPNDSYSFNVCQVANSTAYYNITYLDEGTGNYTLRVV